MCSRPAEATGLADAPFSLPDGTQLTRRQFLGDNYWKGFRPLVERQGRQRVSGGEFERTWGLVRQAVAATGLHPHEGISSLLISGLCVNGQLDRAMDVLEEMQQMGFALTPRVFDPLLLQLARSKLFKEALALADVMRRMDGGLTVASFSSLIEACLQVDNCMLARSKLFKEALALADVIHRMDGGLTVAPFSSLIEACLQVDNIPMALELVAEMRSTGVHSQGKLSAAMGVLREMMADGIRPNVVVFTQLLHGCALARNPPLTGKLSAAMGVLREMMADGIRPNVVVFTQLLHGCALARNPLLPMSPRYFPLPPHTLLPHTLPPHSPKPTPPLPAAQGKLSAAMGVLREMMADGIRPNVVVFTQLLHGCALARNRAMGMRVHEMMQQHGVPPNDYLHAAMALAAAGRTEAALAAFHRGRAQGVQPLPYAVGTMIMALGRAGKVEDMMALFRESRRGARGARRVQGGSQKGDRWTRGSGGEGEDGGDGWKGEGGEGGRQWEGVTWQQEMRSGHALVVQTLACLVQLHDVQYGPCSPLPPSFPSLPLALPPYLFPSHPTSFPPTLPLSLPPYLLPSHPTSFPPSLPLALPLNLFLIVTVLPCDAICPSAPRSPCASLLSLRACRRILEVAEEIKDDPQLNRQQIFDQVLLPVARGLPDERGVCLIGVREALRMFQALRTVGVHASRMVLEALLDSCAAMGDLPRALHVRDEMDRNDLPPTVFTLFRCVLVLFKARVNINVEMHCAHLDIGAFPLKCRPTISHSKHMQATHVSHKTLSSSSLFRTAITAEDEDAACTALRQMSPSDLSDEDVQLLVLKALEPFIRAAAEGGEEMALANETLPRVREEAYLAILRANALKLRGLVGREGERGGEWRDQREKNGGVGGEISEILARQQSRQPNENRTGEST
ncbi:unnamed protein product [Closterium sp. Naga37s-1]|nr:unnamed protein product [Closterium sp. Naga37s-1]